MSIAKYTIVTLMLIVSFLLVEAYGTEFLTLSIASLFILISHSIDLRG